MCLSALGGCATASIDARLSTAEVVRLADAEARRDGYDLREYQRPQVHFTPADDTWYAFYDQVYIRGMGEVGKHFSVTVEDKSKNASLNPGR